MSAPGLWVNHRSFRACGKVAAAYLVAMKNAFFIGSEIYRDSTYGRGHPLAIPRVSLAIDVMRAMGWFDDNTYHDSPIADLEYLARFHTEDYVRAVQNAERDQDAAPAIRQRHNIGVNGNPIFPEMFCRPATAAGGGRLAADLVRAGGVAYNLGGGQHHGQPDQASGFCYFNEPVLTIGKLLEDGCERVFYLDLDAHHGDGVQSAFHDEDRVFTLSIHEERRWPMRRDADHTDMGGVHDCAGGMARNIPVPIGFNDEELAAIIEGAVLPLIDAFDPDAIFIQGGVDALADDPQSKLMLSNGALWRAVASVLPLAPRVILSGGGGYNPYSLARCWSGFWAVLAGYDIPDVLPAPAQQLLSAVTWQHRRGRDVPAHWTRSLIDPANRGPIRPEIRSLIRDVTSM
jgi:acetoin utilization protein AcuC